MPPDPSDAETIASAAAAIAPPDEAAAAAAAARHARLAKPPGALGGLEALAVRIAAMRGRERPRLDARLIVVAAADHGVAARGVSRWPQAVTGQMVANFLRGGAAINVLADHAGARVRVVDAGVAHPPPAAAGGAASLTRLGLGAGTADITAGPAMPRALAERAVAAGLRLFEDERRGEGVDVVGCGEMGIGNTTSAAALIAAATGRPPEAVTGRGAGADDAALARKRRAVARALEVNAPALAGAGADGVGLLAALGGFEIGVLAGVYLGAAAARTPAVMDGAISGAAALVAAAIAPAAAGYVVASHRSAEPGHDAVLERLGLEPLLDLGMRLGEGSGAALGVSLCVAACRVLDEMATFGEAGVEGAAEA